MMFPGPHEPTSEQFNNVMAICVERFKKLYDGVQFYVHGQLDPQPFHVQIGSDMTDEVDFPRFPQTKILRQLGPGYYRLVLSYLQKLWGPQFVVLPDVSTPENDNEISFPGDVESFSHLWVKKRRYGAGEEHRGQSAKYAYIDGRVPVRIDHLFRVRHKISEDRKMVTSFAILRRFQPCRERFGFPWDLWATDLGVHAWQANELGPQETIAVERLTGHFILASINIREQDLWITIAFDHVRVSLSFKFEFCSQLCFKGGRRGRYTTG
ncbi:hypothetical protein C8R43DRAFT_882381 [Mycena crocata]|nr:hypothetical protein C8R43DRAFT_882381 [Mycena crocata]